MDRLCGEKLWRVSPTEDDREVDGEKDEIN
jgi:hypothetical protein